MTLSYTYTGEPFAVNSGASLNHNEAELSYSIDSVTNTGSYTVTISAPETDNYLAAEETVEIIVNKAEAPEILWPSASSITYGQALSESVLSDGSIEYGTFRWAEDVARPSAGTSEYEVIFTPSDTENYDWSEKEYRSKVSVEIAKQPATITVNAAEKTYGSSDPELTAVTEGVLEGDTLTYQLSRTEGENAGLYDIIVQAEENPNYEITAQNGIFTIHSKPITSLNMITSCTVGSDPETQNQTISVALNDGSTALTEGTDYTVAYQAASESMPASIVVTGLGNYAGEQSYIGFITNRSDLLCSFDASVVLDPETNKNTLAIHTTSNRTVTGEEELDAYGDPVYSQRNLALSREFLDSLAAQSITQITFQVKEATLVIPLENMTGESYIVRLAPMNYEDVTWREYVILDEYLELSSSYRFRITTPLTAEELAVVASSADASQETVTEKDVTGLLGLSLRIPKSEEDLAAETAGTELAERKVLLVLREMVDFDAARVELAVSATDTYYKADLLGSGMICLIQNRPENQ